jgi:hypothetical protein
VPYLESLLSAYQTGLADQPAISLSTARTALTLATHADERGKALAAVACALAREHVMPKHSSSSLDVEPPSMGAPRLRHGCDQKLTRPI